MNLSINNKLITVSYKVRINKKTCDITYILISAFCVFVSLIYSIRILFYIGVVFAIWLFIRVPSKRLLPILVFMMPLENMFRGNINLQLVTIGLLILLVKLILNENYKINILVIVASLSIIILVFTSSLIARKLVALDVMRIVVNFAIVSSYYRIYIEKSTDFEHSYINYLIFGCLLLGVFSVSEVVLKKGFSALLVNRMYGIKEDPNYISSYFAISISLLVSRLYSLEKQSGIKLMLLILVFTMFGLLTKSRGFLLAFIPSALSMLNLLFRIQNSVKQKVSFICCIIFTIGIVMYKKIFFLDLIQSIISRVSVAYETGGTGRVDIWKNIISVLFSDLKLFLFGAPDELKVAAHNLFLDILANYGAIMLVLILNIYFITYNFLSNKSKNSKTKCNRNYIALIPLFTMCISYFFLSALLLNVFFYTFVLIAIMVNFNKEDSLI